MLTATEVHTVVEKFVAESAQPTCRKCSGTGALPEFAHVSNGKCFQCMGTGREPKASENQVKYLTTIIEALVNTQSIFDYDVVTIESTTLLYSPVSFFIGELIIHVPLTEQVRLAYEARKLSSTLDDILRLSHGNEYLRKYSIKGMKMLKNKDLTADQFEKIQKWAYANDPRKDAS